MRTHCFLSSPTLFFPRKLLFKATNRYYPYYPEAMTTRDLKIHPSKNQRLVKISLGVSTLLIIILVTVTLIFTIFKPRNPGVFLHPVDLEHFQLLSPNSSVAPLGLVITIKNPNYGRFKHGNCSGYLRYHDMIIAEVHLGTRSYPARSTTNVTTTADIETGKLIGDPNFWSDMESGVFNLTTDAKLSGKVSLINIIKLKAKVYLFCSISLNITTVNTTSICMSKITL